MLLLQSSSDELFVITDHSVYEFFMSWKICPMAQTVFNPVQMQQISRSSKKGNISSFVKRLKQKLMSFILFS